ncbi:GNAT family N-acetyltransferase [Catellatospora tritici]|uniref:GNAT family N-acetyltransferase n=1 Tax=Catellatospora tritici TaxID=2851566 RepID=UPI001C2D270D|nr:GNAT family N-acetyltransferase [Catellatospora tritici]MBV1854753.1 GNAT family N-acetyltransferase [Catellatospora tritici]
MVIEVDTERADEALLRHMYEIRRVCHRAVAPQEEPPDQAWGVASMRVTPPGEQRWHGVVGDPVVAFAGLYLPPGVPTGFLRICVLPEHRRRGYGSALLNTALDRARAAGRTHITGVYGDPAAAGFTAATGAERGHSVIACRLDLPAHLPPVPVPGYRAVSWTGATPADLLDSYARARNAIADAPTDSGGRLHDEWTPERVRDEEAAVAERGQQLRVTAIVADSGEIAALTQLVVPPPPQKIVSTEDTAVVAAHRRRGLATWVKAESLALLVADRPDLEVVKTSNAGSNTGMLAVNRALGFTVTSTWTSVVYHLT